MHKASLRILSIIPYKILPANLGGEKGIAVFNEYLAERAHLIGVTTKNNDPALAKNYKLLNILSDSRTRYANFLLFKTITNIVKSEKITHIITEHPYYGWLAAMVRKATGVKWIVHSHNIEYMRSKSIGRKWWKALKWYEGWAYRNADNVFFISDDDMHHAIKHLDVKLYTSHVVTFGIEDASVPQDNAACKKIISEKHNIVSGEKILLFNGALYHSTNYDALDIILKQINPILLDNNQFRYKIIVCGKGLPSFFNDLKEYAGKNVIYAGFVDDISVYFKAADIFLNPILAGGGVKTKAIEAMAMNTTVVSTALGAMGIKREVCGNKLKVVEDGDWKMFAEWVMTSDNDSSDTPAAFFEYYYWGNIVDRALQFIKK